MSRYDKFSKKNRRLTGYDYRSEGLYFITICTKERFPYFGQVKDGKMEWSDEGIIARDYWLEITVYKPQVLLGEFVVMPNHIHGIIGLDGSDARATTALQCNAATATGTPGRNEYMANLAPKTDSVSRIIGAYKAACTSMIRSVSTAPFDWQDYFHDHIIRNQQELLRIENYILSNPEKWTEDEHYIR